MTFDDALLQYAEWLVSRDGPKLSWHVANQFWFDPYHERIRGAVERAQGNMFNVPTKGRPAVDALIVIYRHLPVVIK